MRRTVGTIGIGVLLGLVACGASDPDNVKAAPPAIPEIIQAHVFPRVTGSAATLQVEPTQNDSLVVIVIAEVGVQGWGVQSLADEDIDPVDHNTVAELPNCERTVEIWSVPHVSGGVQEFQLVLRDSMDFMVFAMEIGGLQINGVHTDSTVYSAPSATAETAPLDVSEGDVVVSAVASCGTISSLMPGTPYTSVSLNQGAAAAAFYVPTSSSSAAAEWNTTDASAASSAVAYH